MAEEEDPFGAFGGEDSDSEQSEDESAKQIAESLLQKGKCCWGENPHLSCCQPQTMSLQCSPKALQLI